MKFWKIIILILLILILISFIAAAIETNYCHFWTTTPPFNSPADYIKTNTACYINGYMAIPGIALSLLWQAIF